MAAPFTSGEPGFVVEAQLMVTTRVVSCPTTWLALPKGRKSSHPGSGRMGGRSEPITPCFGQPGVCTQETSSLMQSINRR